MMPSIVAAEVASPDRFFGVKDGMICCLFCVPLLVLD